MWVWLSQHPPGKLRTPPASGLRAETVSLAPLPLLPKSVQMFCEVLESPPRKDLSSQ